MTDAEVRLLFVYNADSGLFNTVVDAAHKILSPRDDACNLCQITYGWFREREAWRRFLDAASAECQFLHRDGFRRRYPDRTDALPAVFRCISGEPRTCLSAEIINRCDSLDALIRAVESHCLEPVGA